MVTTAVPQLRPGLAAQLDRFAELTVGIRASPR
jgi:hypothetical protein